MAKRSAASQALVPSKKSRHDFIPGGGGHAKAIMQSSGPRTSNLMAPIMLLTGHESDVFTAKFSPEGDILASAGFDRHIFLWNVYGDCTNWATMNGHQGAVMELQFTTDSTEIITCGTDKLLIVWDIRIAEKVKKIRGHKGIVNSCSVARRGPTMICSGSDDGTVKLWDRRQRGVVSTFESSYQVTAVSFNDTADQIFSGGIDNDIKVWDLRKNDVVYRMKGHVDTPTGFELSPDGSYLASNAMDNTVRMWDVRPFAPTDRCVKVFQGHQHNFEKNLLRVAWSPDGTRLTAGSADRHVYIWEVSTRKLLYKLPGHVGSVNEVDFHPRDSIVLSCSSDRKIYLGEIE